MNATNLTGASLAAGVITPAQRAMYDRLKIRRSLPLLTYTKYAQKRPLHGRSGDKIKFRKLASLGIGQTLSEGVPVTTGKQMTYSEIEATPVQFGDFIPLSDKVTAVNQDDILSDASEILGEQMGLTIDTFDRDQFHTGSQVRFANGVATRADIVTKISKADLDMAIKVLKRNNTKFFTPKVDASQKVGQIAIRPGYIAFIHPDMTADLELIDGFKYIDDYMSNTSLYDGEIGKYKNIRFIETTNGKVFTGAYALGVGSGAAKTAGYQNDGTYGSVFCCLIMGAEALGVTDINELTTQSIFKGLGSAGTNDPLDQVQTAGWKAAHCAEILKDDWVYRIEALVTA